jgi:hypothetical protein
MSAPPHRPSLTVARRTALLAGLGLAASAALPWRSAAAATPTAPLTDLPPLADLPPLPPGAPVRRLFSPLEQRFASYLAILPGMTNDVVDDPDPSTYGFMGGGWWRTPAQPSNARVQEHTYTLAWFLANHRAWNPYSGSIALRDRLDAAIGHYLYLQHDDGSWPEYSIDERSKAATGFGIGDLAKTLLHLRGGRQLPDRQTQIEAALRRGMTWFLNPNTPIWGDPVQYANQNASGLAGSTKSLTLFDDRTLRDQLHERIEYLALYGQSPAGFFYEPTGMDVGYNFEVLLPEIAEIYLLTGNPFVLSMGQKFTDWFGYNLLREPDNSGWLTYYAMSARTSVSYYDNIVPDPDKTNLGSFFVPPIPDLGAFFTSREDRAATRDAWASEPGPAPGLAKQDTSPRIIAHAEYGERLPSNQEKAHAIRHVPYLAADDFALIRADDTLDQHYLYVRQPALYLGAFFGTRPSTLVRGGTGFLWHPAAGTLIHAGQTDQNSWATVLPAGTSDAHSNLDANYRIGDRDWDGTRARLHRAPVTVDYQLPDGRVLTTLTVAANSVIRAVQATTPVTEQVPLVLQPGDSVQLTDGTPVTYGANTLGTADGLLLRRGRTTVRIEWGTAITVSVEVSSTTYLRDGRRRVHVLRIPHDGRLTTTTIAS